MSRFISVQSLSHVRLFATPWTAAHQASLSFIISSSLLKLMSTELVIPSSHLILCCPLLLLSSIFSSIRVKVLNHVQLWDSMDCSLLGSSVHRILQAIILEWVAMSSSNVWKWKVKVKSLSPVGLLATSWTAACQAPPSMGFSRQEYWSDLPLPSPCINSKLN